MNIDPLKVKAQKIIRLYEKYLAPWLAKEKNRRKLLVWGAFSSGFLGIVLILDLLVMPVYLREGLEITVPDLSGIPYDEADVIARKSDLSLVIDGRDYFDDTARGSVASQRPLPATLVKPGRRVHIILSLGPRAYKVPDVLGKSPRDAELAIRDAGLTPGQKKYRSSKRFTSGVVMDQQPKANTEVTAKSVVTLYISR